jgi:hypothetical protein
MLSVRFAVGYRKREFKMRGRLDARSSYCKLLLKPPSWNSLQSNPSLWRPTSYSTQLLAYILQKAGFIFFTNVHELTTKPEFNTAFPHSNSLVSTTQDLNNVHFRNGHFKPSVRSLHSNMLLSSPLKINLLSKRTFISLPLLPYPFPTHHF